MGMGDGQTLVVSFVGMEPESTALHVMQGLPVSHSFKTVPLKSLSPKPSTV